MLLLLHQVSKHINGANIMNTLKAKITIKCETCGCSMKRVKSLKVISLSKDEAKKETDTLLKEWCASLKGQNCKVCNSIIKELAE